MIKKLGLILLITAILAAGSSKGQDTVKQTLADIATLDFPGQPTEKDVAVGKMYRLAKPTQSYNALIMDMMKVDSTAAASLKTIQDIDLFYSGVVDGAADSALHKKLLYTKQIMVGKYKGVEFKFLDTSTARKFTVFQRAVYLDRLLFIYNFTVYDDSVAGLDAERERFLNSFTVTKTTAKQL